MIGRMGWKTTDLNNPEGSRSYLGSKGVTGFGS